MIRNRLFTKKSILGVLALITILVVGFLYGIIDTPLKTADKGPKVIYRTRFFNADGGYVKTEYRSVNLDGSDDTVIYIPKSANALVSVLGNKNIAIRTTSADHDETIFIDRNGKDITRKYRSIASDITIEPYNLPAYSADGNTIAFSKYARQTIPSIELFDLKTGKRSSYPCTECIHYQGYNIEGFSRDGKKLYISVVRDQPLHRQDSEPDGKYFYLDLDTGVIKRLDLPYIIGSVYTFYPQYDIALKMISGKTWRDAVAINLIHLDNLSTKPLTSDVNLSGSKILFNGKDVLYKKFFPPDMHNSFGLYYLDQSAVSGINIQSEERYPVLPLNFVNTVKQGEKELFSFLPNSSSFIYTTEHDNGWELRTHTLDTGEDRLIVDLTSERFADKTFYYKDYVGVIF